MLASRTHVDLARLPSCPEVALGVAQCPGDDPNDLSTPNVVFYTASFPHLPAVSRDFSEYTFGKKSGRFATSQGGNALHTAFRLVVDKARAKLNSEGDVISKGARYNPMQMKLALQNELNIDTPLYACDKTFDLSCCKTAEQFADCSHKVAELPVEIKARLGPSPHAHLPVLALALSRPRRVARTSL